MQVNKIVMIEIILNGVYYDRSYERYNQLREMIKYWDDITRIVKNDMTNKNNKISSVAKIFNISCEFATDIVEDILGESDQSKGVSLYTGKKME